MCLRSTAFPSVEETCAPYNSEAGHARISVAIKYLIQTA
jgi:hypothetical protein